MGDVMDLHQIVSQYGGVVVNQEAVVLNDDLCHPVLILVEDGALVPGVMIKNMDSDDPGCIIERNFFMEFVKRFNDASAKARIILSKVEDAKVRETQPS
jgi:hypothetical protein